MLANRLKVLLLAGGIVLAGVALAYVTGALDPFLPGSRTVVASLPSGEQGAAVEPRVGIPPAVTSGDQPAPDAGTAPDSGASSSEPEVIVPQFDVVRVEPDGSMVVAGHAAPDSEVELVTGSRVLGTATAGAGGDFAIVLDQPLKPGDYQFVLRSTAPGNVVSTSVETATVSVPDNDAGEVLVLVEAPGKPSELISVPSGTGKAGENEATEMASAETAGGKQDRVPESGDAAGDASEQAKTEQADEAGQAGSDVDEQSAMAMNAEDASGSGEAASDTAKTTDGGMAAGEASKPATAENASGQTAEAAAPKQPADQQIAEGEKSGASSDAGENASQSTQIATAADGKPAQSQASDEPEQTADSTIAASEKKAADSDNEQQGAQADETAPAKSQPATQPATAPQVVVEAVEIEGRQVFVAGAAPAGGTVRVYANEVLLGQTRASAGGRFLVETERDLPVGDYIIRADLLDGDGSTVIARAAVPFEREPGESVAAVAQGAGGNASEPSDTGAGAAQQQAMADEKPQQDEAAAPAGPSAASGDTAAAKDARSDTETAAAEAGSGAPALPETSASADKTTAAPGTGAEGSAQEMAAANADKSEKAANSVPAEESGEAASDAAKAPEMASAEENGTEAAAKNEAAKPAAPAASNEVAPAAEASSSSNKAAETAASGNGAASASGDETAAPSDAGPAAAEKPQPVEPQNVAPAETPATVEPHGNAVVENSAGEAATEAPDMAASKPAPAGNEAEQAVAVAVPAKQPEIRRTRCGTGRFRRGRQRAGHNRAEAEERRRRGHHPARRQSLAHIAAGLRPRRPLHDHLSGQPGPDTRSRQDLAGAGVHRARPDRPGRAGRHVGDQRAGDDRARRQGCGGRRACRLTKPKALVAGAPTGAPFFVPQPCGKTLHRISPMNDGSSTCIR